MSNCEHARKWSDEGLLESTLHRKLIGTKKTKVVSLKPLGFGIHGSHDKERFHNSQSLMVWEKPPYILFFASTVVSFPQACCI